MRSNTAPLIIALAAVACGPSFTAYDFAGLYEADVETSYSGDGEDGKQTSVERFTLTALSDTELRLEDPQCPVRFTFTEDTNGIYRYHALAASCSTAGGLKTVQITSGRIMILSGEGVRMPWVDYEGRVTGNEEFSFSVSMRARAKL